MLEALSNAVATFIEFVSDATNNFWENLNVSQYSALQVILDIILVAILFYWLIMLIRGSRATNIMIGLFVLTAVFALSRLLNLFALGWLLDRLLTVVLVAIPIIFQQELRRGLEKLGRTKFFLAREAKEIDFIINEIIEALYELAEKKRGALIVFKGDENLKEYIDTGVVLNARVSKELLLSLFGVAGPLHDGAVIIEHNRIVAAGCVLPHSFKEYGHAFGTRHKAALGLSESTDAALFVVSEERGSVSYVHEGEIEHSVSREKTHALLRDLLLPKKN